MMICIMVTSTNIPDPKVLFGESLRSLRTAAMLSQEELAHKASVDRTYVSSCERGKRNVTLEVIVKFAGALNVTPSILLSSIRANGVQS
jgi:transcriptional regulator with XRE-family HTH domain